MNKRQAKKGINPHGSWRRIKKEWFWQPIYTTPRWRKRAKWLWKTGGCSACTHSDEVDGEHCYECVKGNRDNFERR